MCGIAGLLGVENRAESAVVVSRMTAALAHRGPDAEGVYAWDSCAFGHRRLSIFDLSAAGRQPMIASDGGAGIVFNGAIYNFRELRRELEAAGCRFRSQTDTEVLLEGYLRWGIDALLPRLRGMFAFAVWDNARKRLYLVRDRLGVKPLYYAARKGKLAFASTIRALAETPLCGDVDASAVSAFLEYGFVPDEFAIYSGAQKLPAASVLEWDGVEARVREYWRLPSETSFRGNFDDAVTQTRELLLQAVERRLFADVPVGALLSGGIDSSLVCWASGKLGADLTAFTVGTPGDPNDEGADAAETARELGVRHRILPLASSEVPDAQDLVAAYSEPFACSSALGMLSISRVVKQSATVLLTGDGGDDVFLGYPRHRDLWAAELLARVLPSGVGPVWRRLRNALAAPGGLRRARHMIDYATGGIGAALAVGRRFSFYQQRGITTERLADAPPAGAPLSVAAGRHVLADFLDFERRNVFVGEYMTKVDGGTMWHALEARAPFLDQDLWEFAATLPYRVRMRNGQLKAVLRELARREIGPRVAHGRKRGFEIPARRWMLGAWQPQVDEMFRDPVLATDGWVDAAALHRTWQEACSAKTVPVQLWYLYVLELWMRQRRSPLSAGPRASDPAALMDAV